MRVTTIEEYLRAKMFRLRQRLWEDHEADAKQLDHVVEYLGSDKEKGLTAYASQLHREWNTLGERARQLVEYVQVPEAKRPHAEALTREYLTMFVSVVAPGDRPS